MTEGETQARPGGRPRPGELLDLAKAFSRLGATAFGGPAAHIAMMEHEFVRRRGWLTRQEFLDLVGAAGLIPGPSSTEVAIYVGFRRAGWRGLVVAGTCFILPAAILVTFIAWAYLRLGRLPRAGSVLGGVKAAVIAIIAQAALTLGRTALRTRTLAFLGAVAAAASLLGVSPLLVLAGAGLLHGLVMAARRGESSRAVTVVLGTGGGGLVAAAPVTLSKLFLLFVKVGAVVFGSGYVLLAFLHRDFVEGTRWLTEARLLDAVAVGQVTPGPVFTTATFIGYLVAGVPGAVVATVAIFLPSFVFVAASAPFIPRLRRSPSAAAFLDGVNAAAVAVIVLVAVQLARTALVDATTIAIAIGGLAALVVFRLNSAWLVLAGAAIGAAAGGIR